VNVVEIYITERTVSVKTFVENKISLMPEKWNFVKILGPLKKEVRQCLQIDGCKCSF